MIADDDVTLQLTADEPVTGRVTDQASKTMAGAPVRVRNLYWPQRENDPLDALEFRR